MESDKNPFKELERKFDSRLDVIEAILRELKPERGSRVGGVELASELTGLRPQTIYKLTMKRAIPFNKPKGTKKLVFKESDIIKWIESGAVKTETEISDSINLPLLRRA